MQRTRADELTQDAARREPAAKDEAGKGAASAAGAGAAAAGGRNAQRTVKLSFNEQRELDALPEKIAALEAEQKAINEKLEDGSIFARDAKEGTRLTERFAALDDALLAALERWEELEAKRKPS
ncbi:hypothetical protein [Burkholderia plantarii]|uniref:hypothetical protein n=1 Tax=Burkholderia plantarii TaxID=41899 RepID=UPI003C7A06A3